MNHKEKERLLYYITEMEQAPKMNEWDYAVGLDKKQRADEQREKDLYEEYTRRAEKLSQKRERDSYIDEIMKANPQYTPLTKRLVDTIIEYFPKLADKKAQELLLPYVLDIAHAIEKTLLDKVPKELQ